MEQRSYYDGRGARLIKGVGQAGWTSSCPSRSILGLKPGRPALPDFGMPLPQKVLKKKLHI